jgi:hypothetical protein
MFGRSVCLAQRALLVKAAEPRWGSALERLFRLCQKNSLVTEH